MKSCQSIEDPASDPGDLLREGAQARRRRQMRQRVRILHLGKPQGGAAGIREAEQSLLVSDAVRRPRVLEERDLHGRRAESAAGGIRPVAGQEFRQEVLSDRLELHLPEGRKQRLQDAAEDSSAAKWSARSMFRSAIRSSAQSSTNSDTQPNVIFSTVVGDSVVALHRQYRAAGLSPAKMPMASLTTSEEEIAAMGGEFAAGHYTSAPYFMSHDSPENDKFVEADQKALGQG